MSQVKVKDSKDRGGAGHGRDLSSPETNAYYEKMWQAEGRAIEQQRLLEQTKSRRWWKIWTWL